MDFFTVRSAFYSTPYQILDDYIYLVNRIIFLPLHVQNKVKLVPSNFALFVVISDENIAKFCPTMVELGHKIINEPFFVKKYFPVYDSIIWLLLRINVA